MKSRKSNIPKKSSKKTFANQPVDKRPPKIKVDEREYPELQQYERISTRIKEEESW